MNVFARICSLVVGVVLLALTPNIFANPICERLRHELEHHCGAGLEFYSAHQGRELMIMNAPYPSLAETSATRMICTYDAAPGLLSIHAQGSQCEEAAIIAGNLCFRDGFSYLVDLGIDDLTNNRNCSPSMSYSPFDPQLAKGYLWGGGFMRTKYILVINNIDGYVERRPNPDYLGDDLTDLRTIQVKKTDSSYGRLIGILSNIKIETMTGSQCETLKNMLSKPLNNLGVIMIDEMTPHVEFNLHDGATITNGPCLEVRHFFKNFEDAVNYMSRI